MYTWVVKAGLYTVLLAWLVASWFTQVSHPTMCPDDATSENDAIACSFSESYWEARAKFVHAAKQASAELYSLEVLNGSMYTMDIAVVRGTGPGLVVQSSAVHGVEGYAGSAIQIAKLREIARGGADLQPTLVFVHAVNPYGMAHFRRCNENNVDLNRNALHPDQRTKADTRDPNIAGYEDFSERLFNPPSPSNLFDAYFGFWFKAAYALTKYGFQHLKMSMVAAQYHNQKGIFYGGHELQVSHRLLRDFMVEHFEGTTGTVTWIDVHTGLGRQGYDSLLISNSGDATRLEKAFPGSLEGIQGFDGDGGDVGAGYELTVGFVNEFYEQCFPKGREVLVMTQEFGTLSGVLVARAMILENQAFNYDRAQQPFWSTFTRDAFYVRTAEWKRSVLHRGLTVLNQAIGRSSQK